MRETPRNKYKVGEPDAKILIEIGIMSKETDKSR